MDRKSVERLKRALQVRHREFRLGLAQTQQESRTAQHDYGKDEGDRANMERHVQINFVPEICPCKLVCSGNRVLSRPIVHDR